MHRARYIMHLNITLDGEVWELRNDTGGFQDEEVYCSHVSCLFTQEDDDYAGLWSWEIGDPIESDDGLPWCHYCHIPVPEALQTIRTLLE
jgi:hypothetical protein